MACESCLDPNGEIRDCPPFANRDDVVELFRQIGTRSCCLGVLSENIDPTDPDEIVEAFDQAFPDGVTACVCDCLHIIYRDPENDIFQTYQNCHGSNHWLNPSAWCDDCGGSTCLGHLTTVGLDPSENPVSAAQAIEEAFPSGFPCPRCDTAIIFREDGGLCHTTDCGETWTCSASTAAEGLYISNNSTTLVPCSNCATCSNNANLTHSIPVFNVSPEQDVIDGRANENQLNVLLDCILCSNSLRTDFRVNETRVYKVEITGSFVGNFAIGSVGCSACNQVGTQGGVLRLRDDTGAIIGSFNLPSDLGDSDKDSQPYTRAFLVNLSTAREYFWQVTFTRLSPNCCSPTCPNPTYDVRGRLTVGNMIFQGA